MLIGNAKKPIPTIEREHHLIHQGKDFNYNDFVTLGAGAVQNYLITTPISGYVHFKLETEGNDITEVGLYEGSNRVGTTLQTIFNNNRNSANVANTIIHKDISAGTTDGTKIFGHKGGSATNQTITGAGTRADNERVLKQNTKYLLKLTSTNAGNVCFVNLNLYETE